MNNNAFQEQLFEAIETIVDNKLNTLSTGGDIVAGTVIKKVKEHLYKIQCESFTIECIAEEGKEYIANDVVYVYIPSNDYSSNEKIILGKFDNTTGSNLFQNLTPLNQITQNVILEIEEPITTQVATGIENAKSTSITIPTNLFTKKYNRLCLQANFDATGLENCHNGEYGIRLELYSNGIPIRSSDFVFHCLDELFCTNPYLIIPSLTMSKMFNLDNIPIHLVSEIKVILYTKNNFEQNGSITLTNLKIIVGEDVSRYVNKPISLYLDYRSIENYGNNNEYSPIIHALLVDQATLTPQTELLENQTIRWYEYVLGHPGDEYGGLNWRYIDVEDNNLLLDKFVFNENSLTTEIKALWCETLENNLLSIIGESEPIVFKHVLNNYLNNAKDTVITLVGKTQLPVYNSNNVLQYIESNNYNYKMELLDNNIEVTSIKWQINNNGLIKGFIDNETGELIFSKTFTGDNLQTQITIMPEDDYDIDLADSAHNIITCVVNDIYSAEIAINFELLTTQGTNYIFQIKPKDSPYLLNIPGSSQVFEPSITMTDGTVVPVVPNRLSWSWYQYDTYQYEEGDTIEELTPKEEQNYITIENNDSTEATIILQKAFDTEFSEMIIQDYSQTILENNEEDMIETPIVDGDNENAEETDNDIETSTFIVKKVATAARKCNTHILQAKYLIDAIYKTEKQEEITRTIELVAYYPIKVIGSNLITTDLVVDGIFELNWNNEGTLTTLAEEDYKVNDGLITQESFVLSTAPEAKWKAFSEANSEYYTIDNYFSGDTMAYYLRLPQGYGYVSEKVSITAVDASGNLLYQQPLMLTMNNFSIDMTNKWAGGVVTIDEEAATIMATAMGAGHKNSDNSFTGVLMGDVQLNQQSDIDSGLFGFNNGKMVFKLNKDAEFFVGSDKDNYISFKDEEFDLKTQVLKLNALQDNFVIDSTGTSSANFEYEIDELTIASSSQEEETTEGEENNSDLKTEDYQFGEETHVKTVSLDNAVMAAHNNFVITANGELYIKNIKGLSMAKDSLISATSVAGLVPSLKDMQEGLNNNLNKIVESYNYTTANLNKEIQETKDSIDSFSGTIGEEVKNAIDQKRIPTLDENGAFDFSEILGDNPAAIIGSWSINDEYLYASKNGEVLAFLSAKQPSEGEPETEVNNWFLWFKDTSETRSAENATGFGVTKNGTLYAENGSFRGRIEAESGNIAGFDFIKFGDENTPIMAVYETYEPPPGELDWNETSTHLTTFISGKGYNGASSIGESGENIDWKMWFGGIEVVNGSSTKVGRFGVTTNGTLWAQDAHITGTITANEGMIGEWLLQNGNLYTSKEEYTAFFGVNEIPGADIDNTDFYYNLFMGKKNSEKWIGKFGVTNEGIMYAENAIVNGVFKIDKQVLTKYEVGQITLDYPTEIQINGALGAGVIPFLDFGYAQEDILQQSAGLLLQEDITRPYRKEEDKTYTRELFLGNTYPLQSAEDYPTDYDNVFEGGDYLISRYSPGLNIVSLVGQQSVKNKTDENGRGPSRLSLISSAYTSLNDSMTYMPVQIQLIQQYKADLSSDRKAGQMTMLTSEFLFYAGSLSSVDRYDYESGLINFNDTNILKYGCNITITSLDATRREAPRRLDVQTDTIAIDCNNIEININDVNSDFKINRPLLINGQYRFHPFKSDTSTRKGIQIVDKDSGTYFLLDFTSGQIYYGTTRITENVPS